MMTIPHSINSYLKIILAYTLRSICLGGLTLLLSCSTEKPVNLSIAREEVQQYYESGKFDEEINQVIEEARENLMKLSSRKTL